jgi:hypothetical protein
MNLEEQSKQEAIKLVEKKWQAVGNKQKFVRAGLAMEWLNLKEVFFNTSNNGVHIYFNLGDIEVNLWPTTCKMTTRYLFNPIERISQTNQIVETLNRLIGE